MPEEKPVNWDELFIQQSKNQNRNAYLRQSFGITQEQYDAQMKRQNGTCGICKLPPYDKYGSRDGLKLSVDMNKITGVKRGLLCRHCKTALTYLRDDVKVMQAMIEYLRPFQVLDK